MYKRLITISLQPPIKCIAINPCWRRILPLYVDVRSLSTGTDSSFDISDDCSKNVMLDHTEDLSYFRPRQMLVVKTLRQKLDCSNENAEAILMTHPELRTQHLKNVLNVIKFLTSQNITTHTILQNSWLLTHSYKYLTIKFPLIQLMKPRDINDFVPLLKLTGPRLNKILDIINSEEAIVPGKNRIYFISDMLKIEPQIVASNMANRLFMFSLHFDIMAENLEIMIKYKVDPKNIMRDLWAFRYLPQKVEERLKRAKNGHKDKLMPWMVRCTEPILAKSIKASVDEKTLLADESIVEYVSNRLKFNIETTNYILQKHPSSFTVRATKVKEILDYLLNEAGFTPHHIAQVPRILCHSLETTKQRLNELKSHGCVPSSLFVVCKSTNEYNKFLKGWIDGRNKLIRKKKDDEEDEHSQ